MAEETKKMKPVVKYIYNNLIAIDQLLNSGMGGDPQETVSSRLGKLKRKNGGIIPITRPWARLIAHALDRIQTNHCTRSINDSEGSDGLFL